MQYAEVPEPDLPGPRWLKVRVKSCGLCGSDVHFIHMDMDPKCFPAAIPGVTRKYIGHELIAEVVEKTFSDADLDYTLQIHAGNGICLPRLFILPNDVEAMSRGIYAVNSLLARCREVGGNLVVEGAPTEVKDRLKIWGETGSDFVIMKRIKEQIDPSGIMSPGRFVGGL